MRETTRSDGTSRSPVRLTGAAVILACLALLSFGQQRTAPYAVVAGTVFRDDGRALRGAEVSVRPSPEGLPPPKAKPLTVATDQRGEFAFRVPAAPMRYTVGVKAPGFRPQEKIVTVQADERVDVYFQLEAGAAGK